MKKSYLYLLTCLMIFLAVSCKKDEEDDPKETGGNTEYYIRFKADGTDHVIDDQPALLATFSSASSQYISNITGSDGTKNTGFTIQLFDGTPIRDTVYTGYENKGTYYNGALLSFSSNDSKSYGSGYPSDAYVTVDTLTATYIKGTFSGTVRELTGTGTLSITEGKFYVKRVN